MHVGEFYFNKVCTDAHGSSSSFSVRVVNVNQISFTLPSDKNHVVHVYQPAW
jgi:hypothetical protein